MIDDKQAIDPAAEAEVRADVRDEVEEAARRARTGHGGDMIDTTLGNMGGAGASAAGPDIAKISRPEVGNASDLPSRP